MKRIIAAILLLGLLSNPISALKQPEFAKKVTRYWQCISKPDKFQCTKEERDRAKKWLIGGTVGALVTALIAAGLVTGAYSTKKITDAVKAKKEQISKEQKESTTTELVYEKEPTTKPKVEINPVKQALAQLESYVHQTKEPAVIVEILNQFPKLIKNAGITPDELASMTTPLGIPAKQFINFTRKKYKLKLTPTGEWYIPRMEW